VPVTVPAQRTPLAARVVDEAAVAATLVDLRAAAIVEGRPLSLVVADHVADTQPHALDLPAAWSAWGERKAALSAAVRAA